MLAATAAAAWTAIGWPLARRVVPAAIPPLTAAPVLGWAVHTTLAAVLLPLIGFTRPAVVAVFVACLLAALALYRRSGPAIGERPVHLFLLPVLAALAAIIPAAAILAKPGLTLSAPMFDHSKIALIDSILRLQLPPANPFYGGTDAPAGLAYYWWWHASAAELARLGGAGGWTGDAAMTGFTAWASLLLAGGIGVALAGRAGGGLAILLLLPGSLRWLTGAAEHAGWLAPLTGLGGWLNQASWAPQHLASASALVVAGLVLARLADAPTMIPALTLGAMLAAGFGASTWVGGITAGLALTGAAAMCVRHLPPQLRTRFLVACAAAVILGLAAVAPLLRDQAAAAVARAGGTPVRLLIYRTFGPRLPGSLANLAGFPLLLAIEFPALAIAGAFGAAQVCRRGSPLWQKSLITIAAIALLTTLLLRSTVDNNDLGWRAVLPALLIAAPCAAAATLRAWRRGGARKLLAAWPLLGLPSAIILARVDVLAQPAPADTGLAASAPAWAALHRLSGPGDRVASNPDLAARATPWPANIAWALLSDRPSCYASWATAHAFAPVPTAALYATDQEIRRVFAGHPAPADLPDLVRRLHCRFVLLLPGDGAWARDPFAAAPALYHPVATTGTWRIYQATSP